MKGIFPAEFMKNKFHIIESKKLSSSGQIYENSTARKEDLYKNSNPCNLKLQGLLFLLRKTKLSYRNCRIVRFSNQILFSIALPNFSHVRRSVSIDFPYLWPARQTYHL